MREKNKSQPCCRTRATNKETKKQNERSRGDKGAIKGKSIDCIYTHNIYMRKMMYANTKRQFNNFVVWPRRCEENFAIFFCCFSGGKTKGYIKVYLYHCAFNTRANVNNRGGSTWINLEKRKRSYV